MSDAEPNFTMINYIVCYYCKHLAIGFRMDSSGSWNYGCSKIVKDKEYVGIAPYKSNDGRINGVIGCEKFEPSGLQTHPALVARLIENNSLAKNIPIDPNATETSWDFANKMLLFSHVECEGSLEVVSS